MGRAIAVSKIEPHASAAHLKSITKAVGGSQRPARGADAAAPAQPDTGIVSPPPRRPAAQPVDPGLSALAVTDIATGLDHWRGRCQGAHGRASDVRLRGPGPGQSLTSTSRPKRCPSRRLVGPVRVPWLVKARARAAERRDASIRVTRPVEVREARATRQVARLDSTTATGCLRDRLGIRRSTPPVRAWCST